MTKALLKKQLMEAFSWVYFNRKNGKKRTKAGTVGFALLYLGIFVMLGYVFYMLSLTLCEPLCEVGIGWLYFVLMSMIAVVLGVFGSVFNTFSSLYQAKDNDLLLSMPIPVSRILLIRLCGVYLTGLMYELIVMIPALIVWFWFGRPDLLGIVFSILMPFVLSFFVLTLSSILGWVVALVSARVKNKSFVTVILSLIFLAAYYYFYMKAYTMLTELIAHAQGIAGNVKTMAAPLYHLGRAAEGNAVSMLIFTAIIAVLFAVVYAVLSRSFLKLATTNKGSARVKYREKTAKAGNADSALLRKEFMRFTGSANYMLNCGLGIIFMLVGAVALIIKRADIMKYLPMLYGGTEDLIPLLSAAALCMIISMSDISAPSVSLEGKNLWIAQVLPVSAWKVLKAKLTLHLLLTLPPAAILTACTLIVLKPSVGYLLLIPAVVFVFIITMALFGLFMNLKAPNLKWTNEVVPIKQSLSVSVTLFGGWGMVMAFGALYYVLWEVIDPLLYLAVVGIVLAAAAALLYLWIKKRGTVIFSQL